MGSNGSAWVVNDGSLDEGDGLLTGLRVGIKVINDTGLEGVSLQLLSFDFLTTRILTTTQRSVL
ncbi:unnamed protein product, partial [Citrullus colocynthis]